MSVRMQKHVELLDSFPKPSSKMQQYLVPEMKTPTSANAHRLGSVKMMRERQIYCHTWKEKKNLRKWRRQLQDYCSQNSPVEWGFLLSSLGFFFCGGNRSISAQHIFIHAA